LGTSAEGKDLGTAMRELVLDLAEEAIVTAVGANCPEKSKPDTWTVAAISDELQALLGVHVDLTATPRDRDLLLDRAWSEVERFYNTKESSVGADVLRQIESYLYLQTIDARWKEHLQQMDHLREGIHMRSYAQRDPKQEYKKEGYNLFVNLMARIRDEVLEKVFKAQVQQQSQEDVERLRRDRQRRAVAEASRQQAAHPGNNAGANGTAPPAPVAAANGISGAAMRPPAMGASSSTLSVAMSMRPPAAGSASNTASAAARARPMPTPRTAPRPAVEDDDGGLNRAQRRKMKAQKRKSP
jgi:preprotein translocase subunit SecA